LLLLGLAASAQAQTEPAGQFQCYPLRHKAAADVEKTLGEMLSSLGPTTQVVADVRNNQLMVRGPQQAQQIARQLIESIDRPTANAAAVAPVLKAYPCPAALQADAVNRLRSQTAGREDVRIAADPATSQIFILAPPALQEVLAPQPGATDPAPAPNLPSSAYAGAATALPQPPSLSAGAGPMEFHASPANHEQFVQLANSRVEQLEPVLQRVLGQRLQPLPNPSPARPSYAFIDANGNRLELRIDHGRNGLGIVGPDNLVRQFLRLVENLDTPADGSGRAMRIVPVERTDPAKVDEAVRAYKTGGREQPNPNSSGSVNYARGSIGLLAYLFQQEGSSPGKSGGASGVQPIPSTTPDEDEARRLHGMSPDVDVEYLPDLDVIILHGRDKDVQEVSKIIEELERIATQTQPAVAVCPLKNTSGDAMMAIIAKVSDSLTGSRQGRIMVMSLSKPNSLLLIGWGDAVQATKELIEKLDLPVPPDTQFRVFPLHSAPAAQVRTTLQDFVTNRMGLAGKLVVTADVRTNSLIVQGAPRDLAELAAVIENLDKGQTAAVVQTRIFKLKNAMAIDLAGTLQSAIATARGGSSSGSTSSLSSSSSASAAGGTKSAALELFTVDPRGQKIIKSGILADVQITPDPRLNTLVVSAPAESMGLIAELIQQLDSPVASAQIKVFRILNSDAASMALMLRSLLTRPAGTSGGTLGGGSPTVSLSQEESVLTPLRFSVDARTNSIIAVGSSVDLRIVEALLLRLDEFDVQHRKSAVYRLKNAPAMDVANAINSYVLSEQKVQQAATGMVSAAEQIESQVVVVPEQVSNALIISATPRFFQEINDLVEKLDEAPAQVMIQVLIAQVTLSNYNEFGIEVGLQDSVLFDRSLLGNLVTVTNSQSSTQTQTSATGANSISNTNNASSTNQSIVGATNTPGYSFNGTPLGNSGSPSSLSTASLLGTQGVSSFGTGLTNSQLGFGGLVLQASSENVSALLRALQEEKTMRVLSRPQIMTLDNQPAYVQVGSRVPRIQGTSVSAATLVNSITLENVGLILGVTPRVSPEGMVVMEVDAENSSVGPIAQGTPVSAVNGTTIYSPAITVTMAQTTISVRDGQTVVLAGLLTKSVSTDDRKVPILGDIPVINWLFHYHNTDDERSELLIVLTPHVVRTPEEMDRVKKVESARMHWCLKDVECIHGNIGVRDKTPAVYPDIDPRGKVRAGASAPNAEEIPAPPPVDKTSKWPLWNFGHKESDPAVAKADPAAAPAPVGPTPAGYQEPVNGQLPGVVYPAIPSPQNPSPATYDAPPAAGDSTAAQEPTYRR
jgi:type II secretion system protein D